MKSISLGFIGFGEAGFHIARGLRESGLVGMTAYDLHRSTPGRGELIEERAAASGVTLVGSSEALASGSDLLLSLVVADAAIEAAIQTAPYLAPRHVYADLNSVSPETKNRVSAIVVGAGAAFVEAAIMGPVPPHGHRVPMLVGGSAAGPFVERLGAYGMQMEFVSDRVGSAAAVKMCRSIVVKGLEALLLECAVSAEHYGAGGRVFASLEGSFPGLDWAKLASYMMGRVIVHGDRRAQEMDEVSKMLDGIGIEPIMAQAASRRQQWCADLDLPAEFRADPPGDYRETARTILETAGTISDVADGNLGPTGRTE